MTDKNEGLITLASEFSAKETAQRLVDAINAIGMTVFARIDHAKGAADVGMNLRATELILFGNPKGGTPLMIENQLSGIDLPLKALVWEDANARVWLTYNDAHWIAQRHQLTKSATPIDMMTGGLAKIAASATKR